MKSFDISINNINLKSDDINKFLNRGQSHKAVDFIVEQSQCSRIEADEIVEDLKRLRIENRDQTIGNWKQVKESRSTYVDSTERQPKKQTTQSTPKCPKCGSTQFTPVRKKFSLLTGFATNKVEMVCNSCGTVRK